ncbi:cytidine deaminase-like protein [Aspergillus pseudodeflectus]|uniref:Cytidine deaminase-like protein n=1 Tax=Aspergillus pseudodeflectus TaxID=176178 RepID=A0ABR4LAT1_9EURO
MISQTDITHLNRCIALAREALVAGDSPFGSILVSSNGTILKEERNRIITTNDVTAHPELRLVQWAQKTLSPAERAASTVYTSGEHCPMCATAHAFAGMGRIVYAASTEQLVQWRGEWGVPLGPVAPLGIREVVPGLVVEGPVQEVCGRVRELHRVKHLGGEIEG